LLLVTRLNLVYQTPDLLKADFSGPVERCGLFRDVWDLARIQEAPEKKATYYAQAIDAYLKRYQDVPKDKLEGYREEEKRHFNALVKVLTEEPDAYKWQYARAWANECVKRLKKQEEAEKADRLQKMIERHSSKSTAPPREGKSVASRETALG
jgi:hypothetical protein